MTDPADPTGEAFIVSGILGWIYARLPRRAHVVIRRRLRLVIVAMWLPVLVFVVANAWTRCSRPVP